MRKLILLLSIAGIIIAATAEKATSIPAFARKYRLSCQTCHNPIPRLKAYGDDFAGNGFQLEDREAPRYYVETGDPELSLIRELPLAVRFEGHVSYNNENTEQPDFGTPYLIKLLSGGALTNDISYYFYMYFDERGEVAGVEDAYLMFNNLFGVDFDIYAGQFQVSDPLFKRELRLTLEDYSAYTINPGISDVSMKYDRGLMLTYGTDFGTSIVAEVVNGNGLAEANAAHLFDKDDHKNVMGRVSQDIGEYARIGGFIYGGSESLVNENGVQSTNDIMIWGPDITLSYEDILELNMQYVNRTDDGLFLTEDAATPVTDFVSEGITAELIFMPQGDDSKWYCAGLFNQINSDDSRYDYQAGTLHFGYLVRRNIRLVAEGTYNFTDSDNAFAKFSVGFVSGF